MQLEIIGNPGTGNTFMEVHIENYNPNLTTVVNNYNGVSQKPTTAIQELPDAEREQRKAAILQYVAKLARYVSKDWKNRYDTLWKNILSLPEVEAEVYNPGRQKGTTFNRNLIANILYIMCNDGVIVETNATKLTEELEGDKDHPVRAKLKENPVNRDITDKILSLLSRH